MKLYYVKAELWGVPAGGVERFSDAKAAPLVLAGAIEPYDEKNKAHATAKSRQERESDERRRSNEALLVEEREHPHAFQARERARRKANQENLLRQARAVKAATDQRDQEAAQIAKRLRAEEQAAAEQRVTAARAR